MMSQCKRALKKLVPGKYKRLKKRISQFKAWNDEISTKEILFTGRILEPVDSLSESINYAKQFRSYAKHAHLSSVGSRFIYPFDNSIFRVYPNQTSCLASITVNFGRVLDSDLRQIKDSIELSGDAHFRSVELSIVDSIEILAKRIHKKFRNYSNSDARRMGEMFPTLIFNKPCTLEEALQKILFYNAMFWQMRHLHIGLGRLDKILYPYYEADLKAGIIDREGAKTLLRDFCETLHRDYRIKSPQLLGDTGQYILLGGIDKNGVNVSNEITRMFLELFAENPMTDPKLIVRINRHTPDDIWELSVNSILKGSGSPLLMNEDMIIPSMIKFGYDAEDLSELGTSACWEPLIIGKSFDQNNPFFSASALQAVNETIYQDQEYKDVEAFMRAFNDRFFQQFESVIDTERNFDCSPLFTLFFDDCIKRGKDFAKGGAKYAYHGVQVVGLPNAVNSLMNIKKYVFEQKIISLDTLRDALKHNFEGHEDLRMLLLAGTDKFGKCSDEVLLMTNQLMDTASEYVKKFTCNGNALKVGFSSPNYIGQAREVLASADGRKSGEPLAVHISPVSADIDISEILDFATNLDYSGNRLNGNVVDFIIPPSYAKQSHKLIALLKDALKKGVYELQLNVLDRNTLIDAKKHPEKYPNLIVRVWGFSAYFNELPEEYKDNLINRAEIYN